MGLLSYLFYPWSLILQVVAVIHFIRRRPAPYWIYIIIFLGPIGALIYLVVEALPDLGLLGQSLGGVPRRKRVIELEGAVKDNPSAGNYEELGDLYLDAGDFQQARAAFDKAIAARADTPDCFYHRAICALRLGDAAAAVPDLEFTLGKDPSHDFHRAAGLLAQAYAQSGQKEKAETQFRLAVARSTLSETYLNFADLLASQGRNAEAREWAQKVLDKEQTMPAHLRRRERPWFRSASELLRRLATQDSGTQTASR
jgi:hypothetical protein